MGLVTTKVFYKNGETFTVVYNMLISQYNSMKMY